MVKDHSDSERERGKPLPPHGLLFPISSKGSFISTITDMITHTTAFVTPVVECCTVSMYYFLMRLPTVGVTESVITD